MVNVFFLFYFIICIYIMLIVMYIHSNVTGSAGGGDVRVEGGVSS